MLEWSHCPAVERGARVPVRALFENLEDGVTVDDFLEWFPGVTREQIEAVPAPGPGEVRFRRIVRRRPPSLRRRLR